MILKDFDKFLLSFFQQISNIRQFMIWSRYRITRCYVFTLVASIILTVG